MKNVRIVEAILLPDLRPAYHVYADFNGGWMVPLVTVWLPPSNVKGVPDTKKVAEAIASALSIREER